MSNVNPGSPVARPSDLSTTAQPQGQASRISQAVRHLRETARRGTLLASGLVVVGGSLYGLYASLDALEQDVESNAKGVGLFVGTSVSIFGVLVGGAMSKMGLEDCCSGSDNDGMPPEPTQQV